MPPPPHGRPRVMASRASALACVLPLLLTVMELVARPPSPIIPVAPPPLMGGNPASSLAPHRCFGGRYAPPIQTAPPFCECGRNGCLPSGHPSDWPFALGSGYHQRHGQLQSVALSQLHERLSNMQGSRPSSQRSKRPPNKPAPFSSSDDSSSTTDEHPRLRRGGDRNRSPHPARQNRAGAQGPELEPPRVVYSKIFLSDDT